MAVTLKGQTAVYEGTSTDTKPTDADNNAIFRELDTGIRYYYDGTDWNEIPSSGGGGGGTGTDNYNELNNKPSINGTVLSGNKSLDNLGIQAKLTFDSAPTEDSENPVKSGGVYSALAGKQDTISDLSTIRSGAAAGATAVQPAALETALAQKQDALSSEQLDAVNSGITSTDVAQIETNKNNISSLWNNGAKNHYKITSTQSVTGITFDKVSESELSINGTFTASTYVYFNLTANNFRLPAGTWKFRFTTTGTVPNRSITFGVQGQGNTTASKDTDYEFTTTGAEYLTAYTQFFTNDTVDGSIRIMVRPANATDPSYQPYAMSNVELTAGLVQCAPQITANISTAMDSFSGNRVDLGYVGSASTIPNIASQYVVVRTYSCDATLDRRIQIVEGANGGRASRYFNGTSWSWNS